MRRLLFSLLGTATIAAGSPARVERLATLPSGTTALPMRVVGRAEPAPSGMIRRQWPGSYVETRFRGRTVLFRVGAGEVSLRVSVDGGAAMALVRPAPGVYRVGPLAPGVHLLRVQVVSEGQAEATEFGDFRAPADTEAAPTTAPRRQIEFIGDSHTVGYANTSTKNACSTREVWDTTDTARGLPGLLSARYGADYQVNAISGRGVVRNYAGNKWDTIPTAYPYTLFDKARRAAVAGWNPQVIVIALGTNDFSTALRAGERWKTRAALRGDFEQRYAQFLSDLRTQQPRALIIVWATDLAGGEIARAARATVERLVKAGEHRIAVRVIEKLGFRACHGHPDLADDAAIASALAEQIDLKGVVW